MTVIRKPATTLRRLSGGAAATPAPAVTESVATSDDNEIENSSRAIAGVEGKAVTGFTCGLCLTWLPQGTQHTCPRAGAVIHKAEAAARPAAMTAEEQRLLAEAGQA